MTKDAQGIEGDLGPRQAGIRRLVLPALFAALISAGAIISFPLPGSPVPIVLQNLMAVLAGLLLGPAEGGFAVLLFLLLGALGFPVFSGGHGGLAWLAGPTGGYLVGYLVAAIVAGLISRFRNILMMALASALGFLLILAIGVLRLKALRGSEWSVALAGGLLPFLPGDAIKAVVAAILGWRLGPFMDRLLEPKFTEPD